MVCPKVVYTSILEWFMAISMGIWVQTMGFWGTQWYPDDVLERQRRLCKPQGAHLRLADAERQRKSAETAVLEDSGHRVSMGFRVPSRREAEFRFGVGLKLFVCCWNGDWSNQFDVYCNWDMIGTEFNNQIVDSVKWSTPTGAHCEARSAWDGQLGSLSSRGQIWHSIGKSAGQSWEVPKAAHFPSHLIALSENSVLNRWSSSPLKQPLGYPSWTHSYLVCISSPSKCLALGQSSRWNLRTRRWTNSSRAWDRPRFDRGKMWERCGDMGLDQWSQAEYLARCHEYGRQERRDTGETLALAICRAICHESDRLSRTEAGAAKLCLEVTRGGGGGMPKSYLYPDPTSPPWNQDPSATQGYRECSHGKCRKGTPEQHLSHCDRSREIAVLLQSSLKNWHKPLGIGENL